MSNSSLPPEEDDEPFDDEDLFGVPLHLLTQEELLAHVAELREMTRNTTALKSKLRAKPNADDPLQVRLNKSKAKPKVLLPDGFDDF